MKSANLRYGDDLGAAFKRLDLSAFRRILPKAQVTTALVVVCSIRVKSPLKMSPVYRDYVINALSTDRSDDSLDEWVLPRTAFGCSHLLDTHVLHHARELGAIDRFIVVEDICGDFIERERFPDLLGSPRRCWVGRHPNVSETAIAMSQDDKRVQDSERQSWHSEKIASNQSMVH